MSCSPVILDSADGIVRDLRPLTAPACAAMGHVRWIEADNPADALREMFDALQTQPYNAAVWANAGDVMLDRGEAGILSDWREINALHRPPYIEFPTEGDSLRNRMGRHMSAYFNAMSRANRETAGHDAVIDIIRRSIGKTFETLFEIAPPDGTSFDLRADIQTKPFSTGLAHTDSAATPDREYRLLQAFSGPSTCIINNLHSRIWPNTAKFRHEQQSRKIATDVSTTLWEVPRNSITMIGTTILPWQTILHCEAVTPRYDPRKPRMISLINLRYGG